MTATSWLAWTALALAGLAGGVLVWLQSRCWSEQARLQQQRLDAQEQGLLTLGKRLIQLERRLNELADRQVLQRAMEQAGPEAVERAEQARWRSVSGSGNPADSEAESRLRALLATREEGQR